MSGRAEGLMLRACGGVPAEPAGVVRLRGVDHKGSRTGVRRCTPDGGVDGVGGVQGPLGEQVDELHVSRVLFTSPPGSRTSVWTLLQGHHHSRFSVEVLRNPSLSDIWSRVLRKEIAVILDLYCGL